MSFLSRAFGVQLRHPHAVRVERDLVMPTGDGVRADQPDTRTFTLRLRSETAPRRERAVRRPVSAQRAGAQHG
jgi:hypothetical protein